MRKVQLEPIEITLKNNQFLKLKSIYKKDSVPISDETFMRYITNTGIQHWELTETTEMNFTLDGASVGIPPEEVDPLSLYLAPIDNVTLPVIGLLSNRVAFEADEFVLYVRPVNVTFTAA